MTKIKENVKVIFGWQSKIANQIARIIIAKTEHFLNVLDHVQFQNKKNSKMAKLNVEFF